MVKTDWVWTRTRSAGLRTEALFRKTRLDSLLMSIIELVVDRPEPGHQPAWNHVRISKVAVARETYK